MRFGLFTLFDFFPERQNEADYYRRTLELISQQELRAEFGIEHHAFYLRAGARDMDRAGRALELFSREVAPYFRE